MSTKKDGRGGRRPGAGRKKKEIETFEVNTVLQNFPQLANLTTHVIKLWDDVITDSRGRYDLKHRLWCSRQVALRTLPAALYEEGLREEGEGGDDAPIIFPVNGHPGNDFL
jgi:hypothetical protein